MRKSQGMAQEFRKITPLLKVSEKDHVVTGIATGESPDSEGEICDYPAACKAYQEWSDRFQKSTTGSGQEPSLGNIRVQHSTKVGGKAIAIRHDDSEKSIYLDSTPIDSDMWNLIKKGFYTGYSHSGSYLWRKCNECGTAIDSGRDCPECKKEVLIRYAPSLAEVSYVDNPSLDSARFVLVKSNGKEEIVEKRETKPYGDVKYADPGYQDDGVERYPVDTKEHIRAAWSYIHQKRNRELYTASQLKHIEGAIVSEWKKKIDPDGPPESRGDKAAKVLIREAVLGKAKSLDPEFEMGKGLCTVAELAVAVDNLARIQQSDAFEQVREGDEDSEMPEQMASLLEMAARALVGMAQEETAEAVEQANNAAHAGRERTKKMSADTTLSKARSLSAHLRRMEEDEREHHEKTVRHHERHHEVMAGHFKRLRGILGEGSFDPEFEEDGEPHAIDPERRGTRNIAEEPEVEHEKMRKVAEIAASNAAEKAVDELIYALTKAEHADEEDKEARKRGRRVERRSRDDEDDDREKSRKRRSRDEDEDEDREKARKRRSREEDEDNDEHDEKSARKVTFNIDAARGSGIGRGSTVAADASSITPEDVRKAMSGDTGALRKVNGALKPENPPPSVMQAFGSR